MQKNDTIEANPLAAFDEAQLEFAVLSDLQLTVETGARLLDGHQYQRACGFLEKAIAAYPETHYLQFLLALAAYHAVALERAVELLIPLQAQVQARMLLARTLGKLGATDDALRLFDSLYGEVADEDELRNWHAEVLSQSGAHRAALALLSHPTSIASMYHVGFLQLGLGEWEQGWPLFRHRDIFYDQFSRAETIMQVLDKRVLFFHEQGYGDCLMFVRYAALLRPLVKQLIIAVPTRLRRMVQTLDIADFQVVDIDGVIPEHDIGVAFCDAPGLFGTRPGQIPPSCFKLQHPCVMQPGPIKRIGLCWKGGTRNNVEATAIDWRKSMAFDLMRPLLDLPYEFVSLQMEPTELPALFDPAGDYLDSAQKLMEIDLVISVCTSVSHLAGVIGMPVWSLQRFDAYWAYLWDGSTRTGWYPSMRLFRQPAPNTWPLVIAAVRTALA